MGSPHLKDMTTSQSVISLSSGEAELYALVKGAAQTYGVVSMLADFGFQVGATVCTDAFAAIGMVHRQGFGKVRHIDIEQLWVQKDVSEWKLGVVKVGTDANPADFMTQHLRPKVAGAHLEMLGYRASKGRAANAPMLMACSWGDCKMIRRRRVRAAARMQRSSVTAACSPRGALYPKPTTTTIRFQ